MKIEIQQAAADYKEQRERFITAITALSAEQQQFRPTPESWNALQIMKHLIIAEKQSMLLIRRSVSDKKNIRPAGIGSAVRSSILTLALWSPFRFKAPKIAQVKEDAPDLKRMMNEWESLRSEIETFIEAHSEQTLSGEIYRHPRAGVMNMIQTLGFMQMHILHHQKQLERNLTHPGFPKS